MVHNLRLIWDLGIGNIDLVLWGLLVLILSLYDVDFQIRRPFCVYYKRMLILLIILIINQSIYISIRFINNQLNQYILSFVLLLY